MANILATQSAEMRAKGEAPIQQADKPPCESWNERMWNDGEPIDPSPTIDQAVHGGVLGISRLEPGAGSALQLVPDLTADAFVTDGTHRFRLRVVAQHCAATLPSRRAAGVQASGGFSGAEKATPSSRSPFTRNGVCLFGWKPLDARRGQRPKPSERRLKPPKCCTTPTTGLFALCSGLHRQAHRWNDERFR
jgi:hypothetical protein